MELDQELTEVEELDALDANIRQLVDEINEETASSLRIAVHFSGDEHTLLFVRDDVEANSSAAQLAEKAKSLVVLALSDPPRQRDLAEFGDLDATVRWYDDVVVTCIPIREWSGLVFAFDKQAAPVVDLARKYLD